MTLKEQLEILRGEPIQVFDGDPKDIPCIETSDAEKLCKNPLVSVNMITYNHEPYIRQAIEGVMMQKTDFEFELIIGEDCSQDKTREICFEYQKKYPDKIRVLWWHENVSKLGGNSRRVMARCRGEFIALCEGDDYWIDPLKLQKQLDIMREHPDVGLCFTGSDIVQHETGERTRWDSGNECKPGLLDGSSYVRLACAGNSDGLFGPEAFLMTATLMFRSKLYFECVKKYDIFSWILSAGDITLRAALGSLADLYYLEDTTSVYRKNQGSVCALNGHRVNLDAALIRAYFLIKIRTKNSFCCPAALRNLFYYRLLDYSLTLRSDQQKGLAKGFYKSKIWRSLFIFSRFFPLYFTIRRGRLNKKSAAALRRYHYFCSDIWARVRKKFSRRRF